MEPERRVEAEGEQGQGGRDPDIQKESQFHGRTAPEIKREPDTDRETREGSPRGSQEEKHRGRRTPGEGGGGREGS